MALQITKQFISNKMANINPLETEEQIIERYKKKNKRRKLLNWGIAIVATVAGTWFINWVANRPSVFLKYPTLALEKLAEIGAVGDANAGLMGPPIAIASAILTFLAFFIQYVANWHQKNQFNLSLDLQRRQYQADKHEKETEDRDQVKKEHKERVESRFFELLSLHKQNVGEMNLAPNITGRRCFGSFYYELKSIYDNILEVKRRLKLSKPCLYNDVDATSMAYNIFFFGIGHNSEKFYISDFSDEEKEIFYYKDILKKRENKGVDILGVNENLQKWKDQVGEALVQNNELKSKRNNWPIHYRYLPYDGHANLLGHYYRHLFQTVQYILRDEVLIEDEKRQYLRMLRAQLSNYEQLVLFYNATVWFPEKWEPLFVTYRFIKNIPIELATLGYTPMGTYENEMINLWKQENKKKLFEGQGDITELIARLEAEAAEAAAKATSSPVTPVADQETPEV